MTSDKLIADIDELNKNFNQLMKKLKKDISRQQKIMARADKRQKKEYDELQKRLEEVEKLQFQQRELLDSFIKLLAEAIDAKSPYTGGHCERVPEITLMLAKEVSKDNSIDYTIETKDEFRELSIAAWLHDCGKITTPEYVVDKAVKLETIYNRIHEIRTRFEVIYRDLKISALEKILAGEKKEEVENWLKKEEQKLFEDFEFIAKANVGAEFMNEEDQKRVKEIAKREWLSFFDDTLGLSNEEMERIPKEYLKTPLPRKRNLLEDKPWHIIPRSSNEIEDYKAHGFKMDIPKNLYNKGEIYNLTINKGTLTKEERFKIQEHIIMTIKMLEKLPFPDNLKNVPLYAGVHHETLDGTGYPRKLTKDEIPIAGRILAIADVFEALTASDRPYKKAKKLSEAIRILYFMAKDNHIDKDLFKIFLKSGVYLEYAKKYLKPQQIDEVDIKQYLDI